MTANSPSFRRIPTDRDDDVARKEALLDLAVLTRALPEEGTPELVSFTNTIYLWLTRLRAFPPEQVRAGCEMAALEWTFNGMPPLGFIADCIRRASGACISNAQKAAFEDEASRAWASVRRKIRSVGPWFDPHLTKEELWAVNSIGGWDRLCMSSSKDLDFLAKDFAHYYVLCKKDPAVISKTKSLGMDDTILGIPIIDASDTLQ